MKTTRTIFVTVTLGLLASYGLLMAQNSSMTFFVASSGGKGGDLGGVAGADRICQTLAMAAGAGNHTWHAYLSAAPANGQPAVNAKDRIGRGPWVNAKGVTI